MNRRLLDYSYGMLLTVAYASLIAFWVLFRFVYLETAPPGFYVDEAGGAGIILCLAEEGRGYYEVEKGLPFFAPGPSWGRYPPTYIYPAAVWTWIFGSSIASFRAFAGFFNLIAILGLFAIARLYGDRRLGLLVVLAALVSPWSFHLARLAWGPSLMPAGLIWGCYFLLRNRGPKDMIWSAIWLCFGHYCYGSGQIYLVMIVPAILAWQYVRGELRLSQLAILVLSGLVLSAPFIWYMLYSAGTVRFSQVSLFAPEYVNTEYGGSYFRAVAEYFSNVRLYLTKEFFFEKGDMWLRHSPPQRGQLSWLDIWAWCVGALSFLWMNIQIYREKRKIPWNAYGVSILLFWAYIVGISPSAMTWDSQPHVLRAVMGWPALVFVSALLLRKSLEWSKLFHIPIVLSVILFSYDFLDYYFREYAKVEAVDWFHANQSKLAPGREGDEQWRDFFMQVRGQFDRSATAYFMMHYGNYSCSKARQLLEEIP